MSVGDPQESATDADPYAYELAETILEDGDWKLMYGEVKSYGERKRHFMHHTCTEACDDEGNPKWTSWYVKRKGEEDDWCPYCASPPSDGLLATFVFMGYCR